MAIQKRMKTTIQENLKIQYVMKKEIKLILVLKESKRFTKNLVKRVN